MRSERKCNSTQSPLRQHSAPVGHRSRRGIALLLVLIVIAITMALSYTIVRSQISQVQIQSSSSHRDLAYEAALTGISTALRQMSNNAWAGVGVPISGALSTSESYQVTFTTGDPALTPTSASYADYPYRVTLLSTGTSVDPVLKTTATRKIQAVVRLIVAQLGAETSDWQSMQQFTAFQTAAQPFTINVPCRIEGPIRVQGNLGVCPDYSWQTSYRSRYFSDLTTMSGANQGSYSPLTGPISMVLSNTLAANRSLLSGEMALTLINTPVSLPAVGQTYPTKLTSYCIYPGGQQYAVPQLNSTVQNTTLAPDPVSNPLGIFFASNNLSLNNVTIQGTLIGGNEVHVAGVVHLQSFNLPAIKGSTLPVRLPVAVAQSNFVLDSGGSGDATGLILAKSEMLFDTGPASEAFAVLGRVISDSIVIRGRTQWNVSSFVWSVYWTLFNNNLSLPTNQRVLYFPLWLSSVGLSPTPQLTIKPDPTAYCFHWQDPTLPFYVAAPTATGLQWDLVSWTDNP